MKIKTSVIKGGFLLLSVLCLSISFPAFAKAPAAPRKVTSYSCKRSGTSITVRWKKQPKITGYQVYRSTSKTGKYKRVKTTSKTFWKNTGLKHGSKYYYKIRAYKTTGGKRVYGAFSAVRSANIPKTRWQKLQDKYRNVPSVRQLIFVQYTGGTKAKVYLYKKQGKNWKKILSCNGYVGRRGINKKKEGDKKTPTGTFNITSGFGIKSKPPTRLPYTKVNSSHYWCADRANYNKLINIKKTPHKCRGEHLIDYKGVYDYGLFTDFNKACTYGKGSAIFMHCTGNYPYTGGCVAVCKSSMLKIMKNIDTQTKICIYPK